MAEISFPWGGSTTGDCGPYSAITWAQRIYELFSITNFTSEGVFYSDGVVDGKLEVTGTASPISVAKGRGCVKGHVYESTAITQFTIPTPSTATRIDRIVLRCLWTAQTVRLAKLAGSEGGGEPSLTQVDGNTWEIPLAKVTITTGGAITVTDERSFCHFRTRVSGGMFDGGAIQTSDIGDGQVTAAKVAADVATQAELNAHTVPTNVHGLGTGIYVAGCKQGTRRFEIKRGYTTYTVPWSGDGGDPAEWNISITWDYAYTGAAVGCVATTAPGTQGVYGTYSGVYALSTTGASGHFGHHWIPYSGSPYNAYADFLVVGWDA